MRFPRNQTVRAERRTARRPNPTAVAYQHAQRAFDRALKLYQRRITAGSSVDPMVRTERARCAHEYVWAKYRHLHSLDVGAFWGR